MENLVVNAIESMVIDEVTYWLPANNNDVMTLVNEAIAKGEIICMRGSAHSFPIIKTLEANATGKPYKYIMLSKMNTVAIDATNSKVVVQGGCHLGFDPWDPTFNATKATALKYSSTLENSLLYQLDQVGLAIPDLGGITHQTVGGFLSTGSSGGSTQFSFEDALIGIDMITSEGGKATLHSFTRPVPDNPDDLFYAAGVATNGLFGVIVSATFQCVPNFFIAGQEATTHDTIDTNNPYCEVDLFGDGQAPNILSVEAFLQKAQYTRFFWWPQKHVNRLVVWKAWQTPLKEGQDWAGIVQKDPPSPPSPPTLKVYEEVPYVDKSPLLATIAADLLFTGIGQWPGWIEGLLADHPDELKAIKLAVKLGFHDFIFPEIAKIFVELSTAKKPPQRFVDRWYTGIPMDNQMSDKLMPIWFTELWIDITKSKEVMNELRDFFNEDVKNAGNFNYEIYAAKANDFWLSPSYKMDVIRIDILWFANNKPSDPTPFYQKFWTRLAKFNYRPHWAKYLPDGNSALGWAYLRNNYPKWDDWKKLRKQLDPKQVFLNDYWRGHFGIDENGN